LRQPVVCGPGIEAVLRERRRDEGQNSQQPVKTDCRAGIGVLSPQNPSQNRVSSIGRVSRARPDAPLLEHNPSQTDIDPPW
jgi:hypothetical protein